MPAMTESDSGVIPFAAAMLAFGEWRARETAAVGFPPRTPFLASEFDLSQFSGPACR